MKSMWPSDQPAMNKVEKKQIDDPKALVAKILGVVGGVLCGCSMVQVGVLLVLVALALGIVQSRHDKSTPKKRIPFEFAEEKPKVKAFRGPCSGEKSEQGSSEAELNQRRASQRGGKGASARGRDAMALHDVMQGVGGLSITTSITVNVDVNGNTEEATRLRASTARASTASAEETARLRASTASAEETARLRASTASAEEAARLRASTASAEEAARLRASTARASTAAVGEPTRLRMSTTSGEPTRLRASTTNEGYGGAATTPPPGLEVWNQARFQQAPRGADQWQLDLMSQGWLVRTHGSKGRVRPFHPLHRSCPLPAHELHGDRITVVFAPTGGYEVLADTWTQQRTWQRPGPWRGYTLLRILPRETLVSAAEVATEVSDGSFECITSD